MSKEFNPNQLTFEQGLERMRNAVREANLDGKKIITSKDPAAAKAMEILRVTNVPDGFQKWQLPVYLNKPSQLYLTAAAPGAHAPEHSHDEGDGVRFIVSGSIEYQGKELTAGDWMFIPAGQKYTFTTGRLGAVMCYCYCCSCASAR